MRLWIILLMFAGFLPSANASIHRPIADFNNLVAAVKMYQLNTGRYPSGAEGLQALVARPRGLSSDVRWIQLMHEVPKDPWGNPYRYLTGDGLQDGFGLYSLGPDGVSATQGNDTDDFNSWSEDSRGGHGASFFRDLTRDFHGTEVMVALAAFLLGLAVAGFWRIKAPVGRGAP